MATSSRFLLRNATSRPVEIHRPSGVLVLPPLGEAAVDSLDPQCLALERRGTINCFELPPSGGDEPAGAAAAARAEEGAASDPGARAGERSPRRRGTGGRGPAEAGAAAAPKARSEMENEAPKRKRTV